MADFVLVPASLPDAIRAWLAQGSELLAQFDAPINIANLVSAPAAARPADRTEIARQLAPAAPPRPVIAEAVTAERQQDGLKRDSFGRYLIQRGTQSYGDVLDAVFPRDEFTLTEAWDAIRPVLASVQDRTLEYFRRSLERDTDRYVRVLGRAEQTFRRKPRGEAQAVLVDEVREPDQPDLLGDEQEKAVEG